MVDYIVFDSPKFRGVRLLADHAEVQPGTYSYPKIPDVLLKLTCGHTERYMRVLSDTLFVRLDAFHKLTLVPTFTESRKETLSALVILYKGVVLERLRGSWHIEGGADSFYQTIDRMWPTKRLRVCGYQMDIRVPPLINHIELDRTFVRERTPVIYFGKTELASMRLPEACGIDALVKLFNAYRDVPLVVIDEHRAVSAYAEVSAEIEMYLEHDGLLPEEHDCPGLYECDHRWSRVRVKLGRGSYSFIVPDPDDEEYNPDYDYDAPYEWSRHYKATKKTVKKIARDIKEKQWVALETVRERLAAIVADGLPGDLAFEIARYVV